jgi:ubiquinone/menaquinone biosynthesis C-methylase UbiE
MGIYKADMAADIYRLKASNKNILDLTGRRDAAQNDFVAQSIAVKLKLKKETVLVDIGCGDGRFLESAHQSGVDPFSGRLVGILPNIEEVLRVLEHLALRPNPDSRFISIFKGDATKTGLPSSYADILVCNGVLQGWGMTLEYVESALVEFNRVISPSSQVDESANYDDGVLFIGELPDSNELASRPYGDSIFGWLWWVLLNQGFKEFMSRMHQVLRSVTGKENLIIVPKSHFHSTPEEFAELLRRNGFTKITYSKSIEIDRTGRKRESATRWDYLAIKERLRQSPEVQ